MRRVLLRAARTLAVVTGISLVAAACGSGSPTATRVASTPSPVATRTAAPSATPTAVSATPTAPSTPVPVATVAQPRYGGTLRVRWLSDSRNWDTWTASGAFTNGWVKNMMSNLVQYKQGTLEISGDLADNWDISADGKVYTFRLHRNATWHDGKPVTSRDIAYNLRRGLDPKYPFNRSVLLPIEKIETPDDLNVRVTLKGVSNAFLPGIAAVFVLMYPEHIPDIDQWRRSPIGSGAFVFKSDQPTVAYEFARNPNYFKKDAQGRQLPYLDGAVYQIIADNGLFLAALRAGRVDCGCLFDNVLVYFQDQLKKDIPGISLKGTTAALYQIYVNVKKPPLDNISFRRGLGIGLDKEKLTDALRPAGYGPPPFLIPPERGGKWGLPKDQLQKIPGFNPNHAADLELAKQQIKQSGIDVRGVEMTFYLSGAPPADALADAMVDVLGTQLGLKIKVSFDVAPGENVNRRTKGDFQILLIQDPAAFDDPSTQLVRFFTTGSPENGGGYSNPKFDQLLADQDKVLDPNKRKEMLWEAQRLMADELPSIPVMWLQLFRATVPAVQNFQIGPLWVQNADLAEVWLER